MKPAPGRKRIRALEAKQQHLLAQAKASATSVPPAPAMPSERRQPTPARRRAGWTSPAARCRWRVWKAGIARETDEYNKRPRKKFVGARTDEYRFAQYIEDWRQKVERVGTSITPGARQALRFADPVGQHQERRQRRQGRDQPLVGGAGARRRGARHIVTMASPYAAFRISGAIPTSW